MRLEWQQQPGKMKVQGRGRSRKSRWRRSVSKERHVEALVVADTSMVKFHEDTYVETYLLTIMNMVSLGVAEKSGQPDAGVTRAPSVVCRCLPSIKIQASGIQST